MILKILEFRIWYDFNTAFISQICAALKEEITVFSWSFDILENHGKILLETDFVTKIEMKIHPLWGCFKIFVFRKRVLKFYAHPYTFRLRVCSRRLIR